MPVLETFKLEEILNKSREQHYPHYMSMGHFCCHGNQSLGSICPKFNASNPLFQQCYIYNLIEIGLLV